MAKNTETKEGLRKDGTSNRVRAGSTRNNRGTPPILIGALVVVVIGAALLFWPKGGSVPTGIGEHQSVVTIPDTTIATAANATADTPRSSDVDISAQSKQLTPEKPVGGNQTPEAETVVKVSTPKKDKPAAQTKRPEKPATLPVEPNSDGKWAVQTGGFGDAKNADAEASRLEKSGWNAMVRAGSNSQGTMVYRVWIGYFSTREEAGLFIKQNRKKLADAFALHR